MDFLRLDVECTILRAEVQMGVVMLEGIRERISIEKKTGPSLRRLNSLWRAQYNTQKDLDAAQRALHLAEINLAQAKQPTTQNA